MTFKLAIADVVEFGLKFSVNDAGKPKAFSFTVLGQRIAQETLLAELKDPDLSVGDFLVRHLTGWRGQTLLIDEYDDTPAAFSVDALRALLNVTGVAGILLQAYLEANGAKGKAGN